MKYINLPLLKEPMNWAVVFVAATIWLLFFHVVMNGFTQMQSGTFNNNALPPGTSVPPQVGAGQSIY